MKTEARPPLPIEVIWSEAKRAVLGGFTESLSPIVCRRDSIASAPARLPAGPKTKLRKVRVATRPDAKRARRATTNRVLTVLKAILIHAYTNGCVTSDDAWRSVKPFAKVDAAKVRYLTDAEGIRDTFY